MEEIKYKEKMLHCSTPCPHGMKATERYTKKPFVVHVGCEIEKDFYKLAKEKMLVDIQPKLF